MLKIMYINSYHWFDYW
uniref:Uncharacterized protein n=1 Tax=Anguilla anguilla TaxID=7936 RepID=A0A0E9XX76_ANGAN